MAHLRKMMLEELERRNYTAGTIRHYLRFVEEFARHFGKSPDKLGFEHLRSYQVYLLKERKLDPASVETGFCWTCPLGLSSTKSPALTVV